MEPFLFYLLRASICMALFYGFYKLFLSRTTFYAINRIVLSAILLLVVVLPLFRYNLLPQPKEQETIMLPISFSEIPIEIIEAPVKQVVEIPWLAILLAVYSIGLLFFIGRYLFGLFQIDSFIRKSEHRPQTNGINVCVTDKNIAPFSWMKYIVISRSDFDTENNAVIAHEKSHIDQKHSFDKLFFDLFACFFWFNPFSWLLRREIQSVHEFQADEYVIQQGIDSKQYQLLLIRKSAGEKTFALANNFLQRDLHKRINMMIKNKTNPKRKIGYLAILPIALIGTILLSVPKLNAKEQPKEVIEDELSDYSLDAKQILDSINIKNKNTALHIIDAKANIFTLLPSNSIESIESISASESNTDGNDIENNIFVITSKNNNSDNHNQSLRDTIKVLNYGDSLPAFITGFKTEKGKTPLFIVDGKKIESEALSKINPDNIKSISVQGKSTATSTYGEEGKNGVIIVTTKKHNSENNKESGQFALKEVTVVGYGSKGKTSSEIRNNNLKLENNREAVQDTLKEIKVVGYSKNNSISNFIRGEKTEDGKTPMVIIDGKKSESGLKNINPDNIKSFTILKDASATAIYGEEGKNGVIIIDTKKTSELTTISNTNSDITLTGKVQSLISSKEFRFTETNKPLIMVDGKEISQEDMSEINPNNIESISVLKDKSATEIYKEKGENGVIIIKMKKN